MADVPREIELKLELDADAAERLRAHPLLALAPCRIAEQRSVYFDTKRQVLRKAGFTLRVRTVGGQHVQTAKAAATSAGLFDRSEWEQAIAGEAPELGALAATPLAPLLAGGGAGKLRPLIVSQVRRSRWDVAHGGGEIEIVLDEGLIEAGGRSEPLCELELELKSGPAEPLFAAAALLAQSMPLRIGVLSKSERGFALSDGTLGKVVKAEPVRLDPAMDVAEAFAAIAAACLRHFRRNEPLVRDAREAAALHQARVAMRRLRAAFSLFAPAMRREGFDALREGLRWFTAKLGDARNLDVFLALASLGPADRERLAAERERAYDTVAAALASQRFQLLMIDLVAWSAGGPWRRRRRAAAPLAAFAATRLDRLWTRVSGPGAMLRALGEEQRHRLRIEIKKLRYAVEFVAGQYDEAPGRRPFRDALETMQESLGHLNDIATARLLHERYGLVPAPEPDDAGGDREAHLVEAERAFAALRRAGPFWRSVDEP
jgi:inorganic triphosphatase YgiF